MGEQAFHQRDLFLFDMGYPSLDLIVHLQERGKDFVFRCSDYFLKEVRQAIEKGENDQQIQIPITSRGKRRPLSKNVRNVDENAVLTLRVLLIPLDSGKSEILLTSLIEKKHFPSSDFKSLYAKRWGVETHFSVLKEHLEIENFTGLSVLSVKQDFFATILTNNFRGLIQQEAQAEIEQDHQKKPRKYAYKINTHLAIGCLKDQLVKILVLEQDITPFCNRLKSQIKKNIVPIRKNRHFLRKSRTRCKKYHITKKRVL